MHLVTVVKKYSQILFYFLFHTITLKGRCNIAPQQSLSSLSCFRGWSGGAMVMGKLPVPGRPTILIIVGQGPIALAVGAGGGGLDIFTLLYLFFPLSPSLWETA